MRQMKDSGIEWIGAIPTDWETNAVSQLFVQIKNKNVGVKEKNLLSLSYGRIKRKSIDSTDGLLPESFDGYNIIEADDIVLRLTDLQNDQRSLRVGLSTERGIVTSAYLTIRTRTNACAKYLYYYLHSFDVAKGFYGMGAGVRQGLNWDGIKWIRVLMPSLSEQQCIADYLDRKCAEIDAVISDTQKTIEEYKALKQSILTEAVTKGIRPNRPMKDSGIEWIGEIPDNWDLVKGHRIIVDTQNGLTRRDLEQSLGNIVLKLKNISPEGDVDYSIVNRISLTEEEKRRYALCEGDFLFVRVNGSKALVGKCAIFSEQDELVAYNDHIIRVRLNELIDKFFFQQYLLSQVGRTEIDLRTSTAAGQFTISGEGLRDISVILPPMVEQKEIVKFLNSEMETINSVIKTKMCFITELELYKKSLIYEYVTGKKEVPVCP